MMIKQLFLNKHELQDILQFMDKYPDAMCVQIDFEGGSGIGQVITAEVMVQLNGDYVCVKKTITDQASW